MEGKREKKENPMEVNTYKEWDRKARTKTQKVVQPVFCEIREICHDAQKDRCLVVSSGDLDQIVP